MFRYVALSWIPTDRRAGAAARFVAQRLKRAPSGEWSCDLNTKGLMVFHADARPGSNEIYVLAGDSGIVLGKLFERNVDEHTLPGNASLSVREASAILQSCGRHLIEHYWGRYVAFLHDAGTRTTWVLRDPTGALPCFLTTFRGVNVFFAHMEDCLLLDLQRYSINWRFVAAFVCYSDMQTPDTGLNEVSAVRAGECLEFYADAPAKRTLCWDPVHIARSDIIENVDEAVEIVRRTTKTCVWAWASCYPRIVHLLSGGLDSSIVLSCLLSAPTQPATTCLNYFGPTSPEEDERVFARLAASAGGFELIESEEKGSTVRLEVILDNPKSATPLAYLYDARHGRFEGELAEDKRASAIFQGIGGDQIFFQNPVILAAADYICRHGIRGDFFQLALDIARMQGVSIWSVLRAAIRDGLLRSHRNPLAEIGKYLTLVRPEVVLAARRNSGLVHPWLTTTDGVAPGKRSHVSMMSASTQFYAPLGLPNDPERVCPLLSQPLMEVCLRIPTYILTAAGWDRAVARRAFRDDLPSNIVSRRAKGGIDQELRQILQSNLGFIRELMLDGHLVKEKLLDRHKVEQALTGQRVSLGVAAGEIMGEHLNTETWLRIWAGVGQRAVA